MKTLIFFLLANAKRSDCLVQQLAEYLFHEGRNFHSYDFLGNFPGDNECTFRVWAPNAKEVYVTGDFCDWRPTDYRMERINQNGIYEITIPNVKQFDSYKYVIVPHHGDGLWKADPYARHAETRPQTASKVYHFPDFSWTDEKWMKKRTVPFQEALNIYEVELSSFKKKENGDPYSYREMVDVLIPYVKEMNYTHIELLPITEYPYDKSWGYQVTGFFAATSRFGTPEDFMYFVDECHKANIGVILDWVPGHFTKDAFGLYEFDGTPCYEYSDQRIQEHKGWGTRVFDYGKTEVLSFLYSSAVLWLEKFHIDGLRVDAVSSMLFYNYCRSEEESARNIYGGFENLEAIRFIQSLNVFIRNEYPGVMMIAEESTAFAGVTKPVEEGGLGFHFKWNMGWMNDSLDYLEKDPLFRGGIHNQFTFSMMYAFSENYILPISHDEVVHGKKSLLDKASVSYEDKFSNYRAFMGYMMAHPGKKLNFMGNEIPQMIEWNEERELDWFLLKYPIHDATHRYVKDLNAFYKKHSELWQLDGGWTGFRWHEVEDVWNNCFVFSRMNSKGDSVIVISNFSGNYIKNYEIGVSKWGSYKVALNSDAKKYNGSGVVNRGLHTVTKPHKGFDYTLAVNVPPFSTLYIINNQ